MIILICFDGGKSCVHGTGADPAKALPQAGLTIAAPTKCSVMPCSILEVFQHRGRWVDRLAECLVPLLFTTWLGGQASDSSSGAI